MKMSKTSTDMHLYKMHRFSILLFIAAIVLMSLHYFFLKDQQIYSDENWLITFETIHTIKQADTIVSIQPPYESNNIRLLGRSVKHAGLHVVPATRNIISKRAMRLRANHPGLYTTEIEYSVQYSETPHIYKSNTQTLSDKHKEIYLADSEKLQLTDLILNTKLLGLNLAELADEKRVDEIYKFVSKMTYRNTSSVRDIKNILLSNQANSKERSTVMVAMSRLLNIPARLITGLKIEDDPTSSFEYWVEIYINDRWMSFYPGHDERNELPSGFIAIDKHGDGVFSAQINSTQLNTESYSSSTDIMIERKPVSIRATDGSDNEWYQVLMLDRLPSDTRDQLSLLMLLPLGVMLCAGIRNVFSIHSYGVFTPTILALAVTYAEIETTALILIITMLLVYFGRPTFDHKMLRTPRLSIVFTLVATSMVIGVSILDYFSLANDGHLILLPIVIITSLMDSFYATVEKLGNHIAFIRLFWTILLTLMVIPVLQLDWLGEFILRYPEFHLITLSILIMISINSTAKLKLPSWLGLLREPVRKNSK